MTELHFRLRIDYCVPPLAELLRKIVLDFILVKSRHFRIHAIVRVDPRYLLQK